MKYEKPVVMNLNARARRVDGQGTLGCVSGPAATGSGETCGVGTGAGFNCLSGGGGAAGPSCLSGMSASGGDCLSGSNATGYCSAGSIQGGNPDPYDCSAGPTF